MAVDTNGAGRHKSAGLMGGFIWRIGLSAAIGLSAWHCDKTREREIPESRIPPAVREAFRAAYPGALVDEFTEDKENGATRYEIHFLLNGQIMEASYTSGGRLVEVEELMPVDSLPSAVVTAISGEVDRYMISKVERITRDDGLCFEVALRDLDTDQEIELVIGGSGDILERESAD